jgi:autophagy-related protein 9
MTSNVFSKLRPAARDEALPSNARNSLGRPSDTDPNMALDEENLGTRFQEQNLEQLLAEATNSDVETESTAFLKDRKADQKAKEQNGLRPKWMRVSPAVAPHPEDDDDVPESLLLEGKRGKSERKKDHNRRKLSADAVTALPPPVPGPSGQAMRARWDETRAQQQLHRDNDLHPRDTDAARRTTPGGLLGDPKERAMWRWANVDNLDAFLVDVYNYYSGHGFSSILLYRFLLILALIFLTGFSTFMLFCIDYSRLSDSNRLEDIRIRNCGRKLPTFWNFLLFIFATAIVFNFITILQRLPGLWEMRNFYRYLLDIPDSEIQTISWQFVVSKLMALRDSNVTTAQDLSPEHRRFLNGQSKQRMDAHDIANRLMRKDNYYIAMVNKDILDCGIYIPFLGKRQFFTRTMEWNLQFAITDLIFDGQGQVKPEFMTARNRSANIKRLQDRLLFVATIAFISAPFLVAYFVIVQFFRNFTVSLIYPLLRESSELSLVLTQDRSTKRIRPNSAHELLHLLHIGSFVSSTKSLTCSNAARRWRCRTQAATLSNSLVTRPYNFSGLRRWSAVLSLVCLHL